MLETIYAVFQIFGVRVELEPAIGNLIQYRVVTI